MMENPLGKELAIGEKYFEEKTAGWFIFGKEISVIISTPTIKKSKIKTPVKNLFIVFIMKDYYEVVKV